MLRASLFLVVTRTKQAMTAYSPPLSWESPPSRIFVNETPLLSASQNLALDSIKMEKATVFNPFSRTLEPPSDRAIPSPFYLFEVVSPIWGLPPGGGPYLTESSLPGHHGPTYS